MQPTYENVICQFGADARETLGVLDREGAHAALARLRKHHDPGEGTLASSRQPPWKDTDETFRRDDYILYFDRKAGYVGLAYELRFR